LVPDFSRKVLSLDFTFPKNKAASGKLTLLDPDLAIFDSNLFRENQRVAFLCGWKHELVPAGPFIIKNIMPSFPASGEIVISVDFQDLSHKMNKKQKQKRWSGSPSSILKRIATAHGLGYDIEEIEGVVFNESFPLIQANMTDAALIQRLAWRYGFVWGIYGNNLVFKSPASLDEAGIQSKKEIPVLRYKHGDYSLYSFSPEIKFSRGGKRKNKKINTSNIDIKGLVDYFSGMGEGLDLDALTTEDMQSALSGITNQFGVSTDISSILGGFGDLGKTFKLDPGQQFSDEDTDSKKTPIDPTVQYFINEFQGTLREYSKKLNMADESNEETDTGDPSGSASGDSTADEKKKQAGKLVRSSETTTGAVVPTIASMYYRPRQSVILVGIGKRLSGKYEVSEVAQTFTGTGGNAGATFETKLSVCKRKFFPSKEDTKIVSSESALPGNSDTGKAPAAPPRYYLNDLKGVLVKKISKPNREGQAKKASLVDSIDI